MNLIDKLGGYEAAKAKRDDINHTLENSEFLGGGSPMEGLYERLESIEQALLEYRRQNGIFEVGDKVVIRDKPFPNYDCSIQIVENQHTGQFYMNSWRHATPAEITANRRLPDDMGDDTHIENHISPHCKGVNDE